MPVHLESEFVHYIGHLSPPHVYLSVHRLEQISVSYIQTIKLVAFVVVDPFVVELLHDLLECNPHELDERVQQRGIVEKVESGEEHSGQRY
jgi:hypothetical protein